jgi:hypothetical protein
VGQRHVEADVDRGGRQGVQAKRSQGGWALPRWRASGVGPDARRGVAGG